MAIFNTTERPHEGIDPDGKWGVCLALHELEQARYARDMCDEGYTEWMVFFARQVGRAKAQQLKAVNDWVNRRLVYAEDQRTRGERDHWASPGQSLRTGRGDCEDFAILKFITLRMLGWTDVRIVLVKKTDGQAHAVCAVHHKGKWLVLDNLMTLIYEDRRLRKYRPMFSMDESGWWTHRKARTKRAA